MTLLEEAIVRGIMRGFGFKWLSPREKRQQKRLTEADFLGRIMAHAYVAEMKKGKR
jgi:hypothetical protein